MEREIRDLLDRALGPAGFDAARDIEGITVNRWSHGYALEYMRPWDQFWPDGPLPIEVSRQGWGRVAIANSDSGAYAYAHSAIDQAGRAVAELLGDVSYPAWADFPARPWTPSVSSAASTAGRRDCTSPTGLVNASGPERILLPANPPRLASGDGANARPRHRRTGAPPGE